MKAVAFESWPEINGFVEKLLIFFSDTDKGLSVRINVAVTVPYSVNLISNC